MAQRHVLCLGEINSSQAEAWRRATEVFDEDAGAPLAAPVGRLPACRRLVARTPTRPLLGRTPAEEPQGDALGSGPASAGDLPAHFAWRRVAPSAWRLVKTDVDKTGALAYAIRPVFHKCEKRTEAHIFVAFLACCLQITRPDACTASPPASWRSSPPCR